MLPRAPTISLSRLEGLWKILWSVQRLDKFTGHRRGWVDALAVVGD